MFDVLKQQQQQQRDAGLMMSLNFVFIFAIYFSTYKCLNYKLI